MEDFLAGCLDALDSGATFIWVDEAFLHAQGVRPFVGLPLWVSREAAGFSAIDSRKAQAAGLTHRPLEQTVRDTAAWAAGTEWEGRKAGLSPRREREIQAAWAHARATQGV
ncbi:hypothetical protein D3C72_2166200 [compost metagenome]